MYVLLSHKSFVDVGRGTELLGPESREDPTHAVAGGDSLDGYQVCRRSVVAVPLLRDSFHVFPAQQHRLLQSRPDKIHLSIPLHYLAPDLVGDLVAVTELSLQGIDEHSLSFLFHPSTHASEMDVVQVLQPFEV